MTESFLGFPAIGRQEHRTFSQALLDLLQDLGVATVEKN